MSVKTLRLPLFFMGLCALILGHNWFSFSQSFNFLQYFGFGSLVASNLLVWLVMRTYRKRLPEESKSWFWIYVWQKVILIGFVLLFAQRYWFVDELNGNNWLSKVVLGSWMICFVLGTFMAMTIEWSEWRRGREQFADSGQQRGAFYAGLSLGLLLCILICWNYIAKKQEISYDVSYLKTTSVSPGSLKGVANLAQDLEVMIFFPLTNDVRPYVADYFTRLASVQPRVKLQFYDKDLNPTVSSQFDVTTNGQVVLTIGRQTQRIKVGMTLEAARKNLRTLDSQFQKALIELTTTNKVAYFTRGHGELNWDSISKDPRMSLKGAEKLWRDLSYSLRLFGIAEGSANKVPDDASLLVIIAPQTPFLTEEVRAIREFQARGGHMLVLLDPRKEGFDPAKDPLMALLQDMGVTVVPETVADVKKFARATRTELDHWLLFTNLFTSHEAVVNLARNEERVAVLIFETASLDLKEKSGPWAQYELLKTYSSSFRDANKNFKQDADEKNGTFILASAGVRTPDANAQAAKTIVFGDATWITELLMPNPANQQMLADALKWLSGLGALSGEVSSEEDIPVLHSGQSDAFLFGGMIVGIPLLVLVIGFVATRRPRRKSLHRDTEQNSKDRETTDAP